MDDPVIEAGVRKAPGCPHYVSAAYFEDMTQILTPAAVGTMRCPGCYEKPIGVFGQFGKSGPTAVSEARSRGRAVVSGRERRLRRRVS